MVLISGGTFRMGSDQHYPEEAPVHHVSVASFWIDRSPVTNRDFRRFIDATGYVTVAEIAPDPKDYPGALPHMLKPGSLVFTPPRQQVDLNDWSQWWKFEFGANWRRPRGRGQSNQGLDEHPVVHIAFKDAAAYAAWAGKELPTEAEWEYAARGGLDGAEFAWGDELTPNGRHMANIWQGAFPLENLATDGYARTSPVGAFPPNGYGLFDMIGNVWEWTTDWFSAVVDTNRRLADRVRVRNRPVLRTHGSDARGPAVAFPKCSDVSRACIDSVRYPGAGHLDLAVPVDRSLSAKRVVRARRRTEEGNAIARPGGRGPSHPDRPVCFRCGAAAPGVTALG